MEIWRRLKYAWQILRHGIPGSPTTVMRRPRNIRSVRNR
jgi:hypothetical protein